MVYRFSWRMEEGYGAESMATDEYIVDDPANLLTIQVQKKLY